MMGGVSVSQVVSILAVAASLSILIYLRMKKARKNEGASADDRGRG
jgi:hypothetical protein